MGHEKFNPADGDAKISTHAEDATAHQDAPALIDTHAEDAVAHQNAPALIDTHAEDVDAHHAPVTLIALEATVGLFQAYPATGTISDDPDHINDNAPSNLAAARNVGEYGIIDFHKIVSIKRWRYYGNVNQAGDGIWRIQYYDLALHSWVNWVESISTRTIASWSDYSTETEKLTDKVKLIADAIDTKTTPDKSFIAEFEIIL